VSGEPDDNPYQPPATTTDPGPDHPAVFLWALLSVMKWGGLVHGLGLLLALAGWPLGGWKTNLGSINWMLTIPVFGISLLVAWGRMAKLVVACWRDRQVRYGALVGGLIFSGVWLLTVNLVCTPMLRRFEIH
jgi:hypothetical protein